MHDLLSSNDLHAKAFGINQLPHLARDHIMYRFFKFTLQVLFAVNYIDTEPGQRTAQVGQRLRIPPLLLARPV